jgi:hypothetical protein
VVSVSGTPYVSFLFFFFFSFFCPMCTVDLWLLGTVRTLNCLCGSWTLSTLTLCYCSILHNIYNFLWKLFIKLSTLQVFRLRGCLISYPWWISLQCC